MSAAPPATTRWMTPIRTLPRSCGTGVGGGTVVYAAHWQRNMPSDFRVRTLDSWQGVWGQHIHSLEFYETDPARGFLRGAKWGLQPTGGPLSMTRSFPWGVENPIWGTDFPRKLRQRLGHSAMWGIIAEDLPDEANRVVLDPIRTDAFGIPAAEIVYRLSDNSQATGGLSSAGRGV